MFPNEHWPRVDKRTWDLLRKGRLETETEGLITAAQDQALRENSVKHRINKQDIAATGRMCGQREETVGYVVAECTVLAQKYYKNWRHDKIAQVIQWCLCEMFGFERNEKWYIHTPKRVLGSERYKMLWEFSIQTDYPVGANKPDIVVLDKNTR